MGLAAFNRMRRERAAVEEKEAERFKEWRDARATSRRSQSRAERRNKARLPELREEEAAASQRIGEKVLAGIEEGRSGGTLDGPLRRDHAAEIAGRNLQDVQTPKDPVDRVRERIPQEHKINEELVDHLMVSKPGPSAELVQAAREETGAVKQAVPNAVAPGSEESVAPQGEESAAVDPETSKTDAKVSRVRIPDDWHDGDADSRKALASKISGEEVTLAKDADKIIREELARRAAD